MICIWGLVNKVVLILSLWILKHVLISQVGLVEIIEESWYSWLPPWIKETFKFGLGGWFIDKFFGSWLAELCIYNFNYIKNLNYWKNYS